MTTAESDLAAQNENRSKQPSRFGSFGRVLSELEPRQLSQSDLAYLRFFLLALRSSVKEVRNRVANRTLVLDISIGIDLLIENAGRRFGFPPLAPEHQATPADPVNQLTLEATPPAAPTFNVQCADPGSSPRRAASLNEQSTPP
jgi:hypothetical protein